MCEKCENIDLDIDMVILENIDNAIDIDMDFLENIDIDIDKGILQNIDIDEISYRLDFGISNRAISNQITMFSVKLTSSKFDKLPVPEEGVYQS